MAFQVKAWVQTGSLSPDDLAVQVAILTLVEFYAARLGRSRVSLELVKDDWERCATDKEILAREGKHFEDRLRRIASHLQPPIYRVEGVDLRLLPGASQISWKDLPLALESLRVRVLDTVSAVHSAELPDMLLSEKAELEEQLRIARSTAESDLLVTCGILGLDEIRQALEELITNANSRLYFAVAYYEENVDFLASYIAERVLRNRLDFRVMYRPRDAQNRRLILKLQQRLAASGYTDFFRAYDPRWLDGELRNRLGSVGHLHAKMALSEREIIVGSANLTHLALNQNLELAVRTKEPRLLAISTSLFERLWDAFDAPKIIE